MEACQIVDFIPNGQGFGVFFFLSAGAYPSGRVHCTTTSNEPLRRRVAGWGQLSRVSEGCVKYAKLMPKLNRRSQTYWLGAQCRPVAPETIHGSSNAGHIALGPWRACALVRCRTLRPRGKGEVLYWPGSGSMCGASTTFF